MILFGVNHAYRMGVLDLAQAVAAILKLSVLHFVVFAIFGVLVQMILLRIPNVDPLTRWALLLYCALPASYLAPSLGRNEDDFAVASGVCSILTLVSLAVFCVIAVIVS